MRNPIGWAKRREGAWNPRGKSALTIAMKKWILLAGVLGMHLSAMSCDLCNLYLGLNPQYNNNQVGLRFRYRQAAGLHSHEHTGSSTTPHSHASMYVTDRYLSSELYARIYLNPKWVAFATLPYAVNMQEMQGEGTSSINGFGDLPLLVQRQLFNRPRTDSSEFGHRMFLGAGVKLPTGKWDLEANDDPHIQPGTGSCDGLIVASYLAQWKKWGLAADLNLRLSTANRDDYRFGNRLNGTLSLFYGLPKGKWTFMPTLGGYVEAGGRDLSDHVFLQSSGGWTAFGTGGLEAYRGRMSYALNSQVPFLQGLNGQQPLPQVRFAGSVGVAF